MSAPISIQVFCTLVRARILSTTRAVEVLSDFEADTVRELSRRFVRDGAETVITRAEREVLEDATAAMSRDVAQRSQLAEQPAAGRA